MPAQGFSGQNFSYIIDADHRFASISEGMLELYPRLKVGQICHKAIYDADEPCPVCPLNEPSDHEITVYNPVIDKWVSVLCSDIPFPGKPNCSLIACSVIKDDNAGIMHRLPNMAGYDVFFEMNISKNAFRRFFRGMTADQASYEEESLDSLMARTSENLVHPLDKERFNEFWDMTTMMDRLRESNGVLHDEFVERNSHGGWDLVHSTIVPDSSFGTTDDIIVAMYTVIRSPHLAQLAIDSTDIDVEKIKAPQRTTNLQALLEPIAFAEALSNQLRSSLPGSRCIITFDVENFRFFNRWISREAGDMLLEEFAAYLRKLDIDYNVLPCHMGADRFAFTLPHNRFLAQQVAADLRAILDNASGNLGFRLAIGAATTDNDNVAVSDILDEARISARRSLQSANPELTWYDEGIAQEHEALAHTLAEINEGLVNNQFVAYLQPKCNLSDGKIIGAEALARWNHPERGLIGPGAFVPILENTGNIHKLDMIIWRQTFALIRSWLDAGLTVPPISVNVSRHDIGVIDVVDKLVELSERYHVLPSLVEVEITESMLAEDNDTINTVINGLRSNGFVVAIDDFGSGYSSLNMLKDIPADILKLDLKFLNFTEGNESKGLAIIRSVIEMSHTLGLPVVVEGVETQKQAETLAELNCHYAQGWLYYKPMDEGCFRELISDSSGIIPEGVRKHYAINLRQRTELARNDFDDAVLSSLKTPVVIYEIDGEDINITKFNEQFSQIIGAEELLRRRFAIQRFIHQQDLPKVYGAFQRAASNPSSITRCSLRFFTESGDIAPFSIAISLISDENGLKHFLGFPSPSTGNDLELSDYTRFEVINRYWLDNLCNTGELPEPIIESVSGAVAYYILSDDEVYLKACNKAVMDMFLIDKDGVKELADRDVLKHMTPASMNAFLRSLNEAINENGKRINALVAFSRAVDGKPITCEMGIHFVRQRGSNYEFIASLIER